MLSREHVLAHEKYIQIFAPYAAAIGIDKEQSHPSWDAVKLKVDGMEARKQKEKEEAALRAKWAEEEKLRLEKEAHERYIIENRFQIIRDYFVGLKKNNINVANKRQRISA